MESSKLHNTAELYGVAAELRVSLDLKGYGLMNKTGLIYTNIGGNKSCQKCAVSQRFRSSKAGRMWSGHSSHSHVGPKHFKNEANGSPSPSDV